LPRINSQDWLDDDYDPQMDRRDQVQARAHAQRALQRGNKEHQSDHVVVDEILRHAEDPEAVVNTFNPTFTSSRYERIWILNYLGPFYDKRQIDDVLRKVKGGKEANVYCCSAGPAIGTGLLAAKVYRPRQFRNLRNDALYREGREVLSGRGQPVRDRRALLAVRMGTRAGKEMVHTSWLAHEYTTLQALSAAGVRVPKPLAFADNTILMEYVGTLKSPAPTLQSVALNDAEARELFHALMHDVESMLAAGRIHADLSSFNVLYDWNDYRIIDFPQAVDPASHPAAYPLFQRDVKRLTQYFERYGIRSDAERLAQEMWERSGPVAGAP
jgi:RIO kinase 1